MDCADPQIVPNIYIDVSFTPTSVVNLMWKLSPDDTTVLNGCQAVTGVMRTK